LRLWISAGERLWRAFATGPAGKKTPEGGQTERSPEKEVIALAKALTIPSRTLAMLQASTAGL